MEWWIENFGECPHGLTRVYCGSCAHAAAVAKREERKRDRGPGEALRRAEERVAAQSDALEAADAYIGRLERQIAAARAQGGKSRWSLRRQSSQNSR